MIGPVIGWLDNIPVIGDWLFKVFGHLNLMIWALPRTAHPASARPGGGEELPRLLRLSAWYPRGPSARIPTSGGT